MSNIACKLAAKVYKFVYGRLSMRVKRMVFWGTVCGYVNDTTAGSLSCLESLNQKLRLCKDSAALGFPAAMRKYVLSDPQFKKAVDELKSSIEQKRNIDVTAFISSLPTWLVYGSDKSVRSDAIAFAAA